MAAAVAATLRAKVAVGTLDDPLGTIRQCLEPFASGNPILPEVGTGGGIEHREDEVIIGGASIPRRN